MHFGIISPPVPGHIHPFGALGRELIRRGHQVTLIHMPDVESRARAEGLGFRPIGYTDHPPGFLPDFVARLSRRQGLSALRFTIQAIRRSTEMMCRDAPQAIREAGIGMLLVDQTEPAGGTIAEHLGLPFVTICNALAINREPDVPPPFTAWDYRVSAFDRVRNRLGYAISDVVMSPIKGVISAYRKKWSLPPHRDGEDSFSSLAQISQQPATFDFPRRALPATFHYVGPLRDPIAGSVPFPWERLDGRPLIYASLGTLQNAREKTFRCFAEACLGLDAQLVITHGGGLNEAAASSLPGNPIVVSYAPQIEVLGRASLTLTHAGLNTALDSLACGVPLVAIPITYEQPAIAARIRWSGAGRVLPFPGLSVETLRPAIQQVLSDPSYAQKAKSAAASIREAGGIKKGAALIERLL